MNKRQNKNTNIDTSNYLSDFKNRQHEQHIDLLTVNLSPTQLAEKHRIPLPTIRDWLFHRRKNELNQAVRKIGRKLLINEYMFLAWIESHSEYKGGK
jgi:hypothetical protein